MGYNTNTGPCGDYWWYDREDFIMKQWYKSKTKMGGALLGLSAVLGTLGGALSGSIDWGTAVQQLITEIGAVYGLFGLRDLPVINK